MKMARPYQKANIPGPEMGTSVSDPKVMANLLKSQKRKVLGIGAESLRWEIDGKKVTDYFIEIANKLDCDVVATGHVNIYLKGNTWNIKGKSDWPCLGVILV